MGQLRELAIDELVAETKRDVGELLSRIRHGPVCGDNLGHQLEHFGSVTNFQKGRQAGPAMILPGLQPARNDFAGDRVLDPGGIQVGRGPIDQVFLQQHQFHQP